MFTILRYGIILFAGVLCLVFAGWHWVVVPAVQYKQDLEERYARNRERLDELLHLRRQLETAKKTEKKAFTFRKNSPDFTLFSYLEQLASQAEIKGHIKYMKPSSRKISPTLNENLVQMRLQDIRLVKLVRFLESVEYAGEGLFFKRLTIRSPKDNPGLLRADLLVGIYEVKE